MRGTLTCKQCGEAIEESHKFCGRCGAKQPAFDVAEVLEFPSQTEPRKEEPGAGSVGVSGVAQTSLQARAYSGDTAAMYEICILHGSAGQYRTAYRLLRAIAEVGDAQAQAALGVLLLEGIGCQPDEVEGRKWLDQADAQGFVPARLQIVLSDLLSSASDQRPMARERLHAMQEGGQAIPLSWQDYFVI